MQPKFVKVVRLLAKVYAVTWHNVVLATGNEEQMHSWLCRHDYYQTSGDGLTGEYKHAA